MPEPEDLGRLRREYAERAQREGGKELYSLAYPPYLFAIQGRQRAVLKALHQHGFFPLKGKQVLEVGCGGGGVLLEFLSMGSAPDELFGIDLLLDRLPEAHHKLPLAGLGCADGQQLPFPADSFDLVLQYTAFSSILDQEIKHQMAREMLRVLKPDGAILWYDFWLNPTNPQTRGIPPAEIRQLFSGCTCHLHKITLAPPLARRVVPVSWGLAAFLESLKFLNSHYLTIITK